jgi:hypothetical protein
MKKMIFKSLIICVFVLGLNTQANAETLKPFMAEKTSYQNYTVDEFINYWSNKSDEELVYYIGGQFLWSAKNTKVSPTQSVYDLMVQNGISYYFGDAEAIRALLAYLERGIEPLSGQVKTAGINSKKVVEPLTRDAYSSELAFTFDWNAVEDMSGTSFLGADVDPVNVFSAKCGNPLYPARVGGGYARVNRNNEGYSQMPSSTGAEKYSDSEFGQVETNPGNTYITNHNYYDQEKVSYEQDEYGQHEDPRIQWMISLNFGVGPLFGNSCCGYGGNTYGYCNHGSPYQQFGYQPAGGGAPQVTNVNIVNEIYNSNTNTNTNTTTVTNTGNPPVVPGPTDPHTNGPIDPSTRVPKDWSVGNPPPRPIKTDRGVVTETTVQSDPRPMKPKDSRPSKFGPRIKPGSYPSASETVTVPRNNNNSGSNVNPNASASMARPDSRPSQKPSNQFTRPVAQQDQPQVDQVRRPQEKNKMDYNPNSRGSSVDQRRGPGVTQSPRKSYSNSSPSRPTTYNVTQPSRGSAPAGGRANSGGGNSGGRSR